MLGKVDSLICVVLTANGFTNFFSFKDVEVDENFLKMLEEAVNYLSPETRLYKALEKISSTQPTALKLRLGHINSIKHIFSSIATHDPEKHPDNIAGPSMMTPDLREIALVLNFVLISTHRSTTKKLC